MRHWMRRLRAMSKYKDRIGFLLEYCSKYPETFNKIANKLNDEFGMRSAEIVLLITYFVEEMSHG